jgi:hypothetical protein
VEKKALRQGITKKQFRNLREKMSIESNKTSFKGGYKMSLPDSNNIQEPEDAQDALLNKDILLDGKIEICTEHPLIYSFQNDCSSSQPPHPSLFLV